MIPLVVQWHRPVLWLHSLAWLLHWHAVKKNRKKWEKRPDKLTSKLFPQLPLQLSTKLTSNLSPKLTSKLSPVIVLEIVPKIVPHNSLPNFPWNYTKAEAMKQKIMSKNFNAFVNLFAHCNGDWYPQTWTKFSPLLPQHFFSALFPCLNSATL